MAEGARFLPAQLQELPFGGIIADGFIIVGGFNQPVRNVLIQNLTDQLLIFSWDGITPNFVLPACSDWAIDVGTNRGTSNTAAIPAGYGVYAKAYGDLPTSGSAFVSYFYLS